MVAIPGNWRQIPPTTLQYWITEFTRVNSPLRPDAEAMYTAAGTHSALVLAFLKKEQIYKTWTQSPIPASFNNPLSIARPGGGVGTARWMAYADHAANVRDWVTRLTDTSYKNGVYTRTISLDDLITVYAPPSENDTATYIADVKEHLTSMPTDTNGTTSPAATLDMSKDLIPKPTGIVDRMAGVEDKPPGVGWDNLGKREVKGLSLHRMQGTLDGTDGYFGDPAVGALTDFGIDHDNGTIYQWADPQGYRSGWASGKYQGAYGDGLAFTQKYGVDAINKDRVSLEVSGNFYWQALGRADLDDPVSLVCLQRSAQLLAHYAHNYGITYLDFPIAPWDGFSFICWHHEFTAGTGKICPGQRLMDLTAQLIEIARSIMKAAQTKTGVDPTPPPTYAPVILLDLGTWDGNNREMADGTILYAINRKVRARRRTPRLQRADRLAKSIGPDIQENEEFEIQYQFKPGNVGTSFLYTPHGTRVIGSHVDPYIVLSKKE